MKRIPAGLTRLFHDQHSVVSGSQLRLYGVDWREQQSRVASGEWSPIGRSCVRLAGARLIPEMTLMAAILDAGPRSVASHQSAAWLWNLHPAPDRHAITIPAACSAKVVGASVHRLVDPWHTSYVRNIPCTNPLRTVVDAAAVLPGPALDETVDRALAARLVTVEGIEAEIGRLSRQGRSGPGSLRRALRRRGYIDWPQPSVLESTALRLFRQGRIRPLKVEVVAGEGGRYRLDALLHSRLAVEFDGYTYHFAPEMKAHDERRRNRILLEGIALLVYTYADVMWDGRRVLGEICEALNRVRASAAPPGRLAP
jgi:very-short-patch-repair endonuclease